MLIQQHDFESIDIDNKLKNNKNKLNEKKYNLIPDEYFCFSEEYDDRQLRGI